MDVKFNVHGNQKEYICEIGAKEKSRKSNCANESARQHIKQTEETRGGKTPNTKTASSVARRSLHFLVSNYFKYKQDGPIKS